MKLTRKYFDTHDFYWKNVDILSVGVTSYVSEGSIKYYVYVMQKDVSGTSHVQRSMGGFDCPNTCLLTGVNIAELLLANRKDQK